MHISQMTLETSRKYTNSHVMIKRIVHFSSVLVYRSILSYLKLVQIVNLFQIFKRCRPKSPEKQQAETVRRCSTRFYNLQVQSSIYIGAGYTSIINEEKLGNLKGTTPHLTVKQIRTWCIDILISHLTEFISQVRVAEGIRFGEGYV